VHWLNITPNGDKSSPSRRARGCEPSLAKNKGGRPRILQPDEATLKTVKGLGHLQATTKECAAFLGVSEPTFLKFKADFPEVAEALEEGNGTGRVSLRRMQFRLAAKNAAMGIFLGKNYLGQTDKHEVEAQVKHSFENMTDDELDKKIGNLTGDPATDT
jgi:hypothetical protein